MMQAFKIAGKLICAMLLVSLSFNSHAQTGIERYTSDFSRQTFANDLLHAAMNLIKLYEGNERENYCYFQSAVGIYRHILENDSVNKLALYNLGAVSNNRIVYILEVLNSKELSKREENKLLDEAEVLTQMTFLYLGRFKRHYGEIKEEGKSTD